MAYILASWVVISLIVGTVLYLTRRHWTHHLPVAVQDFLYRLPTTATQYTRVPTSADGGAATDTTAAGAAGSRNSSSSSSGGFRDDAEAGLHSADFDLAENIAGDDGRAGLDPEQRREVVRLMTVRGIGFDEARREWTEKRFRKQGIGKDGLPRDPKLVTFS